MTRRTLFTIAIASGTLVLLLLLPSGKTLSQQIERVIVTNFPPVQKIEGTVSLEGPVRLAETHAFEEIVVPPVQPTETTRLVDAGMLVAEGFPSIVLSLHGVVRGTVQKRGSVGVILVPDERTIQEAFNEQGMIHFGLEAVATGVSSQTPFFASQQPRYTVGFPRYRVLLYNTTDKTVTANLFAYLTN